MQIVWQAYVLIKSNAAKMLRVDCFWDVIRYNSTPPTGAHNRD